jgi:type IV pilus assembly protein PilY1
VGAQGAGGRGIFALDVTDPEKFKESMAQKLVLWEFTNEDDPQLGYTLARPTIALLPNGRWAAIFGNGYESKDPTGEAALFIVFLDGGLDGVWDEGTDYIKISTSGYGTPANRNGLSTPTIIDVNGDSIADRVYAGDILGNMWVFDLQSSNPNVWKKKYHQLFDTGLKQPITVRPLVTFHPTVAKKGNEPNMMVYFGTGQYLVPGDNLDTKKQNFYAVWDRGHYAVKPSDLLKQEYLPSADSNGRLIDPNLWESLKAKYKGVEGGTRYGWYLDLPARGERVVTPALSYGEVVWFNTLVPNDPKPCSVGGGGWMMSVNAATGGSPKKPVFDFNMDKVVNLKGDGGEVAGLGKIGYGGQKFHGSGGVPTRAMIIDGRRFTAGTGVDDPSKIPGSGPGSGGGGTGPGGSGSGGLVNRDQKVSGKDAAGPSGRLSWVELTK